MSAPAPTMRPAAGFTLIELIIVIIIAAVLAGIAAPNLSTFVKNNDRTTRVNALVTALNLARSEAVKSNSTVTVCASGSGGVLTACNAAPGVFDNGWIAFRDPDGDRTVAAAADIVRKFQPDSGNSTLRGRDDTGTVNDVTYGGDGAARNVGAGTRFVYCDDRGASQARAVLLTITGQPRISRDSDGDGTHETAAGAALKCP